MNQPPVTFDTPRPGLREVSLLLIGAGFATLMFNLPDLAIVCGAGSLLIWAFAMIREPRPGWRVALSLGGGLVAMYMWWPAGAESWAAIPLLWLGAALVIGAGVWGFVTRLQGTTGA